MRKRTSFIALLVVLSISLLVFLPQITYGQNETSVKCGDIVESEFANNAEEHIYLLSMLSKESFEVSVEPAGDALKTVIGIYGPTGMRMSLSGENYGWFMLVASTPKLDSGTLSARGIYKIRVTNTAISIFDPKKTIASDKLGEDQYFGGVGAYTLSIRCNKSNGSVITSEETPNSEASAVTTTNQLSNQIIPSPEEAKTPLFLKIGQTYEVIFGSQSKTVKIIELRNDGWAHVEYDNKQGWLNINQVTLITPLAN